MLTDAILKEELVVEQSMFSKPRQTASKVILAQAMRRAERRRLRKPVIVGLILGSVWLVKSPCAFAQKRGPITEITIEEMSGWFAFSEKYVLTKDGLATAVMPNELSDGPRTKT
jgi:hypothetical protein